MTQPLPKPSQAEIDAQAKVDAARATIARGFQTHDGEMRQRGYAALEEAQEALARAQHARLHPDEASLSPDDRLRRSVQEQLARPIRR